MEIGVCLNMNTSSADPTGVDRIGRYRDAGFDYLELPGGALAFLAPDKRRQLEKAILASRMPCHAVSTLVHPSIRLTGNDVDRAAVDKYIGDVIPMAAGLGVKTAVFGSNLARNVPMHFPVEKAWEQLADVLRRLGDRAARDGVTIVIEHINRLEGNIIETFAEGVAMCEQVNHPHVRCLIDYYHLALGRESMDLMVEKIGLIKHAHFANVLARSIPTSDRHETEGIRFLTALKNAGYGGRISIEGYAASMDEFPQCVEFMRRHA